MQEAMIESKAKKFYLYSGHDNSGSFASSLVLWLFLLQLRCWINNAQKWPSDSNQRVTFGDT